MASPASTSSVTSAPYGSAAHRYSATGDGTPAAPNPQATVLAAVDHRALSRGSALTGDHTATLGLTSPTHMTPALNLTGPNGRTNESNH